MLVFKTKCSITAFTTHRYMQKKLTKGRLFDPFSLQNLHFSHTCTKRLRSFFYLCGE